MALEAAYNQMAFVQFFCTSPTFHFLALDQYSGGSLSIQKRGCATWPKWPDDCKQSVNFLLMGRIHPFPTLRKFQTFPNLLSSHKTTRRVQWLRSLANWHNFVLDMILTSECWFQCHFPQRWIAQSNQLVDFVYCFLFGVRKAWYSCSNHPHQSHLLLGQLNNSVNMQYWNMVAWPHFNRPSSTGRFLISAAMIPHDIRCVMIVEKQDW